MSEAEDRGRCYTPSSESNTRSGREREAGDTVTLEQLAERLEAVEQELADYRGMVRFFGGQMVTAADEHDEASSRRRRGTPAQGSDAPPR